MMTETPVVESASASATKSPRCKRLVFAAIIAVVLLLLLGEGYARHRESSRIAAAESSWTPAEREVRTADTAFATLESNRSSVATVPAFPWSEHPAKSLNISTNLDTYHRRIAEVRVQPEERDKRRILLLGSDNVVGVCEPGEHFGAVVSRVVLEVVGEYWQTINAGQRDTSSFQAYREYRFSSAPYKVDAVVLVVDLSRDGWLLLDEGRWHLSKNAADRWTETPPEPEDGDGMKALARKSMLLKKLYNRHKAGKDGAFGRMLAAQNLFLDRLGPARGALGQATRLFGKPDHLDRAQYRFRESLRRLKAECGSNGVPLCVVLLPSIRQVEGNAIAEDWRALAERCGIAGESSPVEDALAARYLIATTELAVPVLDGRDVFAEWLAKFPGERMYWSADWNLSSKGHYVLGERLAHFLLAQDALRPAGE